MNLTWPRSHSLVILHLTYSATKKVVTILRDVSLGAIAHGVSLLFVAPLPTLRRRDLFVVDAFTTIFCSYLGTAVTRRYAAYTFE